MIELTALYGYVVGRYVYVVGDTSTDPDRLPDVIPAVGTVTLTPLSTSVTTTDSPAIHALLRPVTLSIDSQGYVIDPAGARGVYLITGTYQVSFQFTGVQVPTFTIVVTSEHTEENPLDLGRAAPIPSGPTVKFVVNEQVYQDTLAARDEARLARDEAVDAAEQAESFRDQTEQEVVFGLLWSGVVDLTELADAPRMLFATLTGDTTLMLPLLPPTRAFTVTLFMEQDGAGGHSFTVPGTVTAHGLPITISPDPFAVDVVHLLWTGLFWVVVVGAPNLGFPT